MTGAWLRPGFASGGIVAATLPPSLLDAVAAPGPPADDDERWMMRALNLAMANNGLASPNPVVGCVLVRDGSEIAGGATERWGQRHAERVAVDAARDSLAGATLYVTLEPCSHHGRQPPCAELLASLDLARCVVGIGDPNPLVAGGGIARLQRAGLALRRGVLAREMAAWHLPFLLHHHFGRPVLAGKWAQTLDGQLAHDDDAAPRWITGPAARAHGHWLRQKYDAVLVGAGTVLADDPTLTVRDSAPPHHRQPVRLVFDPAGRVLDGPAERRLRWRKTLLSGDPPTLLLMQPAALAAHASAIGELPPGAAALALPDAPTAAAALAMLLADPALAAIAGRPITAVLVEGGPRLLSLLGDAGLLDLLHVFVAPTIGGGQRHRLARAVLGPSAAPPTLLSAAPLGGDMLLEYLPAATAEWLESHVAG
jgi:diaminohydroxyphosphoribosylaminopyrimidine deaminase/5-amino-6-(5-phosphoribosylamino)uracil reductase